MVEPGSRESQGTVRKNMEKYGIGKLDEKKTVMVRIVMVKDHSFDFRPPWSTGSTMVHRVHQVHRSSSCKACFRAMVSVTQRCTEVVDSWYAWDSSGASKARNKWGWGWMSLNMSFNLENILIFFAWIEKVGQLIYINLYGKGVVFELSGKEKEENWSWGHFFR